MAGEPVNAWDMRVLAGSESALGTTPALAASQYLECINLSLGPAAELGRTRPKQDRNLGRGWTKDFVTGRIEAIPFDLLTSVKSRSAVDANSLELSLLKAGGLLQTVNAATNETYTMPADPIGAASFASVSLLRGFGPDLYRYEAEQLRGGVVRQLEYSGGDKELMLKASGVGIGKYAMGYVASITLANGSVTTLTLSETDSRKIGPGYYKVESEVILVQGTNANMGDTSRTIARAQLTTSGVAHTAVPMVPHMPSGLAGSGSPISEANCTATIDSIAHRVLSFSLNIETGMDLLPGETGSAYIQGVKCMRSKVTGSVKMNLLKEYTADIGKAVNRKSVPISIVCGTGTGGIVTFTLPQVELRPFVVPDTMNDVAVVELPFEAFDSSTGNDQLSIVKT
jgi:hypothetical protein